MSDRTPGQRFSNQRPPSSAAPIASHGPTPSPTRPTKPPQVRSTPPLVGVVVTVLVVIVAVSLVVLGTRPSKPTDAPSTPSDHVSAAYSPSPGWQGIEFTCDAYNATGYWQVSSPVRQDDDVTLETTINVDHGNLRFTFFALSNQSSSPIYYPTDGTMASGTVSAGDSSTGTVIFNLPPGEWTLYIATAVGDQFAALLISG